jgi:hypothetical protein
MNAGYLPSTMEDMPYPNTSINGDLEGHVHAAFEDFVDLGCLMPVCYDTVSSST